MTLDECINRLRNFPQKVGNIAVETMKAEVPSDTGGVHVGDRNYSTGNLRDSIKASYPNIETTVVGTDVEYANIVVTGRKTVTPNPPKKRLKWYDPVWGGKDGFVYARKSKQVAKNPFDQRTVDKLNAMTFEL